MEELDLVKEQLARLPTRNEVSLDGASAHPWRPGRRRGRAAADTVSLKRGERSRCHWRGSFSASGFVSRYTWNIAASGFFSGDSDARIDPGVSGRPQPLRHRHRRPLSRPILPRLSLARGRPWSWCVTAVDPVGTGPAGATNGAIGRGVTAFQTKVVTVTTAGARGGTIP